MSVHRLKQICYEFLDNFICHVVLPYAKIKIVPKIHSTCYVTDKENVLHSAISECRLIREYFGFLCLHKAKHKMLNK